MVFSFVFSLANAARGPYFASCGRALTYQTWTPKFTHTRHLSCDSKFGPWLNSQAGLVDEYVVH